MNDDQPKFVFSCLLDGPRRGEPLDAAAVAAWTPADGKLWLHIDLTDPASQRWLEHSSGLPEVAVDTLLAGETRPRSHVVDEGLLLVLRGVNTNPGEYPEDMVAVRVWVDGNRVISSRRRKLLSVVDVHAAVVAGSGPATPGEFLAALVERLADRIGNFVDTIEERLDEAEDAVDSANPAVLRPLLASIRRQIASVRRFLAPQRDALDRLNRQPVACLGEDDSYVMREEADRITRYLEDLDLARERAVVLQEELLSQVAQQQNARMYVLSVVAAIFLPLTFVTGLLGMNVGGLPGLEDPAGFAWSIVVMILCGAGLLFFFRWKKWL